MSSMDTKEGLTEGFRAEIQLFIMSMTVENQPMVVDDLAKEEPVNNEKKGSQHRSLVD